jgi:hypothetical protein
MGRDLKKRRAKGGHYISQFHETQDSRFVFREMVPTKIRGDKKRSLVSEAQSPGKESMASGDERQ